MRRAKLLEVAIAMVAVVCLASCKAYDFPIDAFPTVYDAEVSEAPTGRQRVDFYIQGTSDMRKSLGTVYTGVYSAFRSVVSSEDFPVQGVSQRMMRFDVESEEARFDGSSRPPQTVYEIDTKRLNDIPKKEFYGFGWYIEDTDRDGKTYKKNHEGVEEISATGLLISSVIELSYSTDDNVSRAMGGAADVNVYLTNLREYDGQLDVTQKALTGYLAGGGKSAALFAFKNGSNPFFVLVTGKTEMLTTYCNAVKKRLTANSVEGYDFSLIGGQYSGGVSHNNKMTISDVDGLQNAQEALPNDISETEKLSFGDSFSSAAHYNYYILRKGGNDTPKLSFSVETVPAKDFGQDPAKVVVDVSFELYINFEDVNGVSFMKPLGSVDTRNILKTNVTPRDGKFSFSVEIDKRALLSLDALKSVNRPKFIIKVRAENRIAPDSNWFGTYDEYVPGFSEMFNSAKKMVAIGNTMAADLVLFFMCR